jgi:hypothetical protein
MHVGHSANELLKDRISFLFRESIRFSLNERPKISAVAKLQHKVTVCWSVDDLKQFQYVRVSETCQNADLPVDLDYLFLVYEQLFVVGLESNVKASGLELGSNHFCICPLADQQARTKFIFDVKQRRALNFLSFLYQTEEGLGRCLILLLVLQDSLEQASLRNFLGRWRPVFDKCF